MSILTASLSLTVFTPELSSIIFVIISPPRPITSLILSGFICIILIFGAYGLSSFLGSAISFSITSSISILATFACARASLNMFSVIPFILMSICSAVIPFLVPATLKSISPI